MQEESVADKAANKLSEVDSDVIKAAISGWKQQPFNANSFFDESMWEPMQRALDAADVVREKNGMKWTWNSTKTYEDGIEVGHDDKIECYEAVVSAAQAYVDSFDSDELQSQLRDALDKVRGINK